MAVRRSALVPAIIHGIEARGELGEFGTPVVHQGRRAHDQRWAKAAVAHLAGIPLISRQEQRDKLHGFTQAHLIGQNAAKTLVTQRVQPLEAFDLIRAPEYA